MAERMKEVFEKIYQRGLWGQGSGPGSNIAYTRGYIKFIEKFITQREITSVVDLGCGDWQFSRFMNWGKAQYQGFDVVESVIETNKSQFSSEHVKFILYPGDPENLPAADLLIAKDVLQHWSNQPIEAFLPLLKRYKFALITNCVNPGGITRNADIGNGDFRFLDLRLPPFNLHAKNVYSFGDRGSLARRALLRPPHWFKRTLLVEG